MMKFKVLWIIVAGIVLISSDVMASGAASRRRKSPQARQARQASPGQSGQQGVEQKLEAQQKTHEQILQKQEEVGAPDEEMEFDALWEGLVESGEIWMRLVDRETKGMIVETYIDWYKEQGIIIEKPVIDYMLLLDNMALQNPGLFDRPFQNILMFVAVMEYDFDNGMDKDQLARKVLGPQLYEFNRKRFSGR